MDSERSRSAPATGQIILRYWAAARSAAGVETDAVEAAEPVSLAELVEIALGRHADSPRLPSVLAACSVLVGDQPASSVDRRAVLVRPGQHVEFLPPFAGG